MFLKGGLESPSSADVIHGTSAKTGKLEETPGRKATVLRVIAEKGKPTGNLGTQSHGSL